MLGLPGPRFVTAAMAAALLAVAACEPDEGHPPVARASATPRAIPENDGFQTPVALDASESADPIDDPDNTEPLTYRWKISSDEYRYDSGSDSSPDPVLLFRGDRPATIELTVTDADGMSHTIHFELQLTVTL